MDNIYREYNGCIYLICFPLCVLLQLTSVVHTFLVVSDMSCEQQLVLLRSCGSLGHKGRQKFNYPLLIWQINQKMPFSYVPFCCPSIILAKYIGVISSLYRSCSYSNAIVVIIVGKKNKFADQRGVTCQATLRTYRDMTDQRLSISEGWKREFPNSRLNINESVYFERKILSDIQ